MFTQNTTLRTVITASTCKSIPSCDPKNENYCSEIIWDPRKWRFARRTHPPCITSRRLTIQFVCGSNFFYLHGKLHAFTSRVAVAVCPNYTHKHTHTMGDVRSMRCAMQVDSPLLSIYFYFFLFRFNFECIHNMQFIIYFIVSFVCVCARQNNAFLCASNKLELCARCIRSASVSSRTNALPQKFRGRT